MSTQSKHFIIWLVALTILVVVIAVTLRVTDEPVETAPIELHGEDLLSSL
jgi:hypothetical protein